MLDRRREDLGVTPVGNTPLGVPALHGGRREPTELGRHWPDAVEFVENAGHEPAYNEVRLPHHNRTRDVRQSHLQSPCDFRMVGRMDADGILAALKRLGVPHERIGEVIGRDRTAATKMFAGSRNMKAAEIPLLSALVAEYERDAGEQNIVRHADGADGALHDYVQIEVLPTFAGMGGGGTGEGDVRLALVPRSLVVNELRADPADLLLIDVRGDSMLDPTTGKGFAHGDQLLIHRKDTNPRQPGPFALWFDDGYVVKNVELVRRTGKLRIFSNNPAYSEDEADPDEVRIMGRPVWFARRL